MTVDFGLFILRVLIGLLMAGHGAQKLFGWFGGPGLKGTTGWLASLGFKPAPLWALFAALGEFGGGLLLALGLLNPLGPLAIIGAMLIAMLKVHWSKGFWASKGGIEYTFILLIVSVVLGLLGPGRYSLDALSGLSFPITLTFWGGLLVTIIVVSIGLFISRKPVATSQQQAT